MGSIGAAKNNNFIVPIIHDTAGKRVNEALNNITPEVTILIGERTPTRNSLLGDKDKKLITSSIKKELERRGQKGTVSITTPRSGNNRYLQYLNIRREV